MAPHGMRIRSSTSTATLVEDGAGDSRIPPPRSGNSATSQLSLEALDMEGNSAEETFSTKTTMSTSTSKLLPVLALIIAQMNVSGWHVLGARVFSSAPNLHVVSFVCLRQVLGTAVLLLSSRLREGPRAWVLPKSRTDRMKIVVAGILGTSIMPILYLMGLIYTTPTIAAVWDGPMLPVLVFCVTLALKIEHLAANPHQQIASLFLTVFGSILVLVGDFHHHKSSHVENESWHDGKFREFVFGNVLLVLMIAAYACMTILQRSIAMKYPPLSVTGWIFAVGSIFNLFMVFVFGPYLPSHDSKHGGLTLTQVYQQTSEAFDTSTTFCLGLLYAVVLLTTYNSTAIMYASRHLESSLVTLFAAAQPPITALLELIFFGKPIAALKIAGVLLTVIGMYYFTDAKNKNNTSNGISYNRINDKESLLDDDKKKQRSKLVNKSKLQLYRKKKAQPSTTSPSSGLLLRKVSVV